MVANAGISGSDAVLFNNGGFNENAQPATISADFASNPVEAEEPEEPKLQILDVNLKGVMYTVELALHYFSRQIASNKSDPLDQVLVLQGSLACPEPIQYSASNFGLRGIYRSSAEQDMRIISASIIFALGMRSSPC